MKSYEEFLELNNEEKSNYFKEICNKANGSELRAGKRKEYLRSLSIEDYDYWGSYGEKFDFNKEYEKLVKLNKIAEERINTKKEVKQVKNADGIIVARFEGWDADTGEKIHVGDHIVKTWQGWSKVENAF